MSFVTRVRRRLGRIGLRLLAFNALVVFVPAAGVLTLDVFEARLLEAQEDAMVQQARLLAASLSDDGPLRRSDVDRILHALDRQVTARIRVVDPLGAVLGDTSTLGPQREPGEPDRADRSVRESWSYRVGAALVRLWRAVGGGPPPEAVAAPEADGRIGGEVLAALAGRYGAATRPSPGQRSLTLYSALPVRDRGEVVGAVVVSQSTFRILEDLLAVRVALFRVFLASLVAAALLSIVAATTIARPLRRLQAEASQILDRRGRLRGRFRGSRRHDEIGDLARSLRELSERLERHVGFIESFAADVSHEFKNPLTAIRTATELLSEVEDPAERRRFLGLVEREVAHLERLLSSVREITLIDARLEQDGRERLVLNDWVPRFAEGFRLRAPETPLRLSVCQEKLAVTADPERLAQILENLMANAVGFSPSGAEVELALAPDGDDTLIAIRDHGPGVPEAHRERIFERFFSYRPGSDRNQPRHTGLGLAIVRALVEGHGGAVCVCDAEGGGARFEVRLPRAG